MSVKISYEQCKLSNTYARYGFTSQCPRVSKLFSLHLVYL